MQTITYTPFSLGATTQEMHAYDGLHVAYLTVPGSEFDDPAVLDGIIAATDKGFEFYESITGRDPSPFEVHDGHATLAILPITPFAEAMGVIGFTGIELQPYVGERLFDDVRQGGFEQLPLYELGRNFWFYQDQIGHSLEPMMEGFATVNQHLAAEHANLSLAPVSDPGPGWGASLEQMSALLDLYLADPDASWESLLGGTGYAAVSVKGLDFAATEGDLAGGMLFRIEADHGLQAYAGFWHEFGTLGYAGTAEQAKDNFLVAAQQATGEDYGWMFKEAGTVVTAPAHPTPAVAQPLDDQATDVADGQPSTSQSSQDWMLT